MTDDARRASSALDRRANQLARTLVGYGVGPGTTVVAALASAADTSLARAAVIRAGGRVISVDPRLPQWRIATVAADAAAEIGITVRRLAAALPPCAVWIELDDPVLQRETSHQPAEPLTDFDRAQHPWLPAHASAMSGDPPRANAELTPEPEQSPEKRSPAPH